MRLQEGNPVKKGTDTLRVKKDLQPGAPQRVGRYHFDNNDDTVNCGVTGLLDAFFLFN